MPCDAKKASVNTCLAADSCFQIITFYHFSRCSGNFSAVVLYVIVVCSPEDEGERQRGSQRASSPVHKAKLTAALGSLFHATWRFLPLKLWPCFEQVGLSGSVIQLSWTHLGSPKRAMPGRSRGVKGQARRGSRSLRGDALRPRRSCRQAFWRPRRHSLSCFLRRTALVRGRAQGPGRHCCRPAALRKLPFVEQMLRRGLDLAQCRVGCSLGYGEATLAAIQHLDLCRMLRTLPGA